MPKIYTDQNVLDAAIERLEYIFTHFDNVYFSVSGGKDSSVMVQLANMVAERLHKRYDVLYIDFEAQYTATIDHIYELKTLSRIRDFYHVCLPIALRNAVSIFQPKWVCWDLDAEHIWVRPMPKDAINETNNPFDFFHFGMEFEEFIIFFSQWYERRYGGLCGSGVGIRADESLNRFRTVAYPENKVMYENNPWTTLIKETKSVYSFFPIYDWRTEDIWGAVSKLNLMHNRIYDMMWRNGLTIHQQRLCQPFGDDQRRGLDQFRALEMDTWSKLLDRVHGVNFGNIYCKTSALGDFKTSKPSHMTWEEYAVFLLETIGIYNHELMMNYVKKIRKFFKFYEKQGIRIEDIPETADRKLEVAKKVPSWRRIARAIEKNDMYMSRLSFSMTKSDENLLRRLMQTDKFVINDTIPDGKLKKIYEKLETEL